MRKVKVHKTKTQLSHLVEQASLSDPVVMAQAGKPVIKVISLQMPETQQVKRIGRMTAPSPWP